MKLFQTLKQLLRTIPSREIFVDKYAHANESTHQTELEYKPPKKLPFNQYIDYEAIEDSDVIPFFVLKLQHFSNVFFACIIE